jgi:hypothetical protein
MTHYSVPQRNRTNARKMRSQMTDAELKLWNELRDIDAVCDHIVIASGLMAEDALRQAQEIAQREMTP